MALEITKLQREFALERGGKKIVLPDPNPSFSAVDVMKFYSAQYPELTNGFAEGPLVIKDKAVFTFTSKAGVLG